MAQKTAISTERLIEQAKQLGFDVCRITDATLPQETQGKLKTAIERQYHASMAWMATTLERRKSPQNMWPAAKSAILLGMNYGPDLNPLENLKQRDRATLSVYARNRDYHDVIKGKLKTLAGWLSAKSGADVKVFVDTAPLMEKPLAEKAGLGWQGKHTNLVSREFGSWLFLGSILTDLTLPVHDSEEDHCGSCRKCLDVCPTDAFPAAYQLDARRCISYLTIEHDGPIDRELRAAMGNRIYGCDDCLAVCPWNKYAQTAREAKLQARDDLLQPELSQLLELDDKAFRAFFSGSPIKRIGRNRFMRNVLIACGNSQDERLAKPVTPHLDDPHPDVRGAAIWALSCLLPRAAFEKIRDAYFTQEPEETVREEWTAAALSPTHNANEKDAANALHRS